MRAVRLLQCEAPLVDADITDRQPRPGEARVEICAAGICHSDAHYRAGRGRVALPLTLGHEIAGITDSGERVAVHYLLPDGSMFGKEVDGGYALRDALLPLRTADNMPSSRGPTRTSPWRRRRLRRRPRFAEA